MLIQFRIAYKTRFGQQLMITGTHPSLGKSNLENAVAMRYEEYSDGFWTHMIRSESPDPFEYRYFLRDEYTGTIREEWGENRCFDPGKVTVNIVLLSDQWRSMSDHDTALFSSAFTGAIFRPSDVPGNEISADYLDKPGIELCFMPLISRIIPGFRVLVSGNTDQLGHWDENKALPLGNQDFPRWYGMVSVPVSDFPVEYKYIIQDEQGKILFWEKCPNRRITLPEDLVPNYIRISDEKFDFPTEPWRGTGVAIPVFSLRSEKGWGIGEFCDLEKLTDWATETGIRMIQILPVNDTVARHSWHDSYPYAAISVFALHPVYINLFRIGKLEDKNLLKEHEQEGKRLNQLDKVDYEGVMKLKSGYFKLIYDQQKAQFLSDPGFRMFFEENRFWLEPYAAFSCLRDQFSTPDFSRWERFSRFSDELLQEVVAPESPRFDDIAVHYFIQYHAHLQLEQAAKYARSKGVVLKGDLPIGIYRYSVDAWEHPELFHMDRQTGAPPDDFSVTGQNWRFPTYNWERMAEDNYDWWQKRLRHLSSYFDAFRIDHILGFFRIWEIPSDQVQGLMGYFNPSLPYSRNEILSKGIYFEEVRYCTPYIRDHVLETLFGGDVAFIKSNFLREYAPGCYEMLPEYDSQRKVKIMLQPHTDSPDEGKARWLKIREGLYTLIAEMIFLEKEQGGHKVYYPRHSFQKTFSYRHLDDISRNLLQELYIEFFYRRNEELWREKALVKLPAIKNSTNMLLCGEDLGMVPACVPGVIHELGLLSLEVQRMPKDPATEFGWPERYPYLSVATPSSHDTSTIRGWWEEDREKTQQFYNQVLGLSGKVPGTCTAGIVRKIIDQHLYSPSMWAVFPMQDLLGMDEHLRLPDPHAERINVPGNPEHYWQYRMHLTVETLLEERGFTHEILKMITDSGRNRVY